MRKSRSVGEDRVGDSGAHVTATAADARRAVPARRGRRAPRPGLVVHFVRGVKPDVRGEINRLAAAIRRACPPTHRVFVTVVPNPALEGEDGGYGFGLFQWPTAGPRRPQAMRIGVAAGLADLIEEQLEEPRPQAVRDVCESFLHEWVHYEQWRAGRECTERGVRVRARNLYERFTPADPDTDRPRTRSRSATADGPTSGGT